MKSPDGPGRRQAEARVALRRAGSRGHGARDAGAAECEPRAGSTRLDAGDGVLLGLQAVHIRRGAAVNDQHLHRVNARQCASMRALKHSLQR